MKKKAHKTIFILLLFTAINAFSQQTFYRFSNGQIVNQVVFDHLKQKIDSKIVYTNEIVTNDSIIKDVNVNFPNVNQTNNSFNPYAIHRKKIGQTFNLSAFKNVYGDFYKSNYLIGKPSIINFWFIRCPPCIKEIPVLNNLQAKYKDKVNFIAITFDEKEKVAVFLSSKMLNFEHITNAETELDKMKVEAFPMNLILDKDGKIIQVFGDIIYHEKEINDLFSKQLDEK